MPKISGCIRLLENWNFRREAEFIKSFWDKAEMWRDEYLYAMLKEEWKEVSSESRL